MPFSVGPRHTRLAVSVVSAIVLGGCGRVGFDLLSEANQVGSVDSGGTSGAVDASDARAAGGTSTNGSGGSGMGAGSGAGGSGGAGGGGRAGGVGGANTGGATGTAGTGGGSSGDAGGAASTGGAGNGGDAGLPPVDGGAPDAGPTCVTEFYFGHRYMFCQDKFTYTAAKNACISFGMRLVRINSGQESTYLRLRSQQLGYPKFHIGATDSAQEGVWRWDDGTQFWSGGPAPGGTTVASKFAFWATGEPNNQNGVEDCAEVQSIQGWNDCACDTALQTKPFICEEYADPLPQCGDSVVQAGETCDQGGATATCDQDCSPVVCGDGVVNAAAGEACDDGGSGQYCGATCKTISCPPGCQCFTSGNDYALCTTADTFRNAGVYCGKHGMALATVTGAPEDQALRTQATNAAITDYWIGGTDLDAEGQWMWMNTTRFWSGGATGSASGYQHFAAPPAGGNTRNCLQVTANGTWTDADCNRTHAYICQRVLP